MEECLVLGPQSSGKTSLLERLKWLNKQPHGKGGQRATNKENLPDLEAYSPTTGSNITTLTFEGKGPFSRKSKPVTVQVRESGGSMAPLWSQFYADVRMLVFVVDASNPYRLSAATLLLLEVLANGSMTDKPCAVVFNKADIESVLSYEETTAVMKLDDIVRCHGDLTVFRTSAMLCEGISELLHWIHSSIG